MGKNSLNNIICYLWWLKKLSPTHTHPPHIHSWIFDSLWIFFFWVRVTHKMLNLNWEKISLNNFMCHLSWLEKLSPTHTHPLISICEFLKPYKLLFFKLRVTHKKLNVNSSTWPTHPTPTWHTPPHPYMTQPHPTWPHPFMTHPTPPLVHFWGTTGAFFHGLASLCLPLGRQKSWPYVARQSEKLVRTNAGQKCLWRTHTCVTENSTLRNLPNLYYKHNYKVVFEHKNGHLKLLHWKSTVCNNTPYFP